MKLLAKEYEVFLEDEDFLDIVDTAGYVIGYWAQKASVDSEKMTYTVHYDNGDSVVSRTISLNDMTVAIEKLLNAKVECGDRIISYIEEDDIDGDAADVIVQVAMFGRIVYG